MGQNFLTVKPLSNTPHTNWTQTKKKAHCHSKTSQGVDFLGLYFQKGWFP